MGFMPFEGGDGLNEENIVKVFREKNFRTTPQRIAVYKYLCENPKHPDADEIYKSVLKIHPSFSKTTVYNALKALEENSLIMKVNIDKERIRYDAAVKLHGHFLCEKCGRIYDFEVSGISYSGIDGFEVSKSDVYYSGLCPECK